MQAGDGAGALEFYSEQFGWKKDSEFDMGPMGVYHLFNTGHGQGGGIMTKTPQSPGPFWLYYFNVDAADAAAERVAAHGGKVVNGPMEVPGGQWVAQAVDPQGALLRRSSLRSAEEAALRVMVIVKATADSEAGKLPSQELMAAMGAFNQKLIEAGVFVDAGGLKPSAKGARIAFGGAAREVRPGPFDAVSELVSGYWIGRSPASMRLSSGSSTVPIRCLVPPRSRSGRFMRWRTSPRWRISVRAALVSAAQTRHPFG